ncbi:MAG: hypothetical protein CL862_07370 [Cyanobium sp. NAT70]|nr:hypothetical protein [Cyanobium sp. NAT70]
MDFDFLQRASPELINWLTQENENRDIPAKSLLIEEGKEIESIYVLTKGKLVVKTTNQLGTESLLNQLSPGCIVGEMSWLENRPPVASVEADRASSIQVVPFKAVERLSISQPALAAEFQRLIAEKLALQIKSQNLFIHRFNHEENSIDPLRKALILFTSLNENDLYTLAKIGTLRRIQPGDTLIKQGDPVISLFIILAGDADIFVDIDEITRPIGNSRRGEILGELTLLIKDAAGATATVRTQTGMELLELRKTVLVDALKKNQLFSARFYKGLSCMLSQRSRDQLVSRNFARLSQEAEKGFEPDEINLKQLSDLNRAGSRFHWLCQKFQAQPGER